LADLRLPERRVGEAFLHALFLRQRHIYFDVNLMLFYVICRRVESKNIFVLLIVVVFFIESWVLSTAESTHLRVERIKSSHNTLHVVFKLSWFFFIREVTHFLLSTKSIIIILVGLSELSINERFPGIVKDYFSVDKLFQFIRLANFLDQIS